MYAEIEDYTEDTERIYRKLAGRIITTLGYCNVGNILKAVDLILSIPASSANEKDFHLMNLRCPPVHSQTSC